MRNLYHFPLFLTFCFSSMAYGQNQAIKAVMEKQNEAWNRGDIKGFMDGYWKNDSLRFISSKGITYGWKPVLDNYLTSYSSREKMGKLEFSELKIDLLSDTSAFVVGRWKVIAQKTQGGYFSLVFKMIEGKWVITTDHTSSGSE